MEYRILHDNREFEQIVDLELVVWGLDSRDAVPSNIMHAIATYGGVVIGAFDAAEAVGLALALPLRLDDEWVLWSHMTGVRPEFQGRGIGFGLKQKQRTWALENDYRKISWTFDPLQCGNANFNLHRLGATANIYRVDLYGAMTDEINAGLPSDRLQVTWQLDAPRVIALSDGARSHPPTDAYTKQARHLLRADDDGSPLYILELDPATQYCFAEIPRDLNTLKIHQPDMAYKWRIALREALQQAFSAGYIAIDFASSSNRSCYVLQRPG